MADARDEMWSVAYELWYDTEYNAELSDRLVSRWQVFDDFAKVVVALTASGSVLAGWTLWMQSGFKYMWAVLAGAGAVLSIVSTALGVPQRLKSWGQCKSDFRALAIGCQTLRVGMRVNPQFDVQQQLDSYNEVLKRFGETVGRMPNDFLETRKLQLNCQARVNTIVGEETRRT